MVKTLLAALFLLTLGCARPGWAAEPPALPCGDAAFLAAPAVGAPPAVAVWSVSDLGPKWQPPACTGWQVGAARWVIAVSGRFRGPATTNDIASRIGGVSLLKSVRYWSVSGKHWKDLLSSAQAVTAVNGKARADFSPPEILSGRDFHFVLNDSTVYRGRVSQATSDRLAFAVENVTTVKYLLMPLFQFKCQYYLLIQLSRQQPLLCVNHH